MPHFGGLGVQRGKRERWFAALAIVVSTFVATVPAAADEVDDRLNALEQMIAKLQAEIAALRAERAAATPPPTTTEAPPAEVEQRLAEVERRQEIQAAEIERLDLGAAAVEAEGGLYGLGESASKVYRVEQGLSIGGYGEMLYESIDSSRDDGADSNVRDRLDFLRAVLYTGYKFGDDWIFNSELEFEHASTGSGGEVSVEFAYLDRLINSNVNARVGMVLVPMGLVNELHEPTLFLGAKRPDVERVIIPSTWRENGFGLFGDAGPFTYRTYLINGLRADGFSAGGLRSGRQKGASALAEDFAWVGRLDYTATPGLLAGVSLFGGDSGQDLRHPSGAEIDASTTIWEGHVDWKWRGFQARALYAESSIDDVTQLNEALGLTGSRSIGESLDGGYVQVGYDLFAHRGDDRRSLTPYARWETFDTQAEVPTGYTRDPARDVDSLTLGLALQPLDQIIFKLDYQDYDNEAGTGIDQWNVAVGYLF